MEQFGLILIIAVVAVAFMTLGLAITRIRKGRDLQTDVGNNDDMKALGLVCTSHAFIQEEKRLKGISLDTECDKGCPGCGTNNC